MPGVSAELRKTSKEGKTQDKNKKIMKKQKNIDSTLTTP